jgi:hypothetical protein
MAVQGAAGPRLQIGWRRPGSLIAVVIRSTTAQVGFDLRLACSISGATFVDPSPNATHGSKAYFASEKGNRFQFAQPPLEGSRGLGTDSVP